MPRPIAPWDEQAADPTCAAGKPSWSALLLAGQRPGRDPLASHFGQKYKALIPIAGKSMLARVATNLLECDRIGRVVIMAQEPELLLTGDTAALARDSRVRLGVSDYRIASSIAAIAGGELAAWPVLVTTADHPLLTPAMVNEFLDGAAPWDLAVAMGSRSMVMRQHPATLRTWLKFSDDAYSGANLFAFRGPETLPALDLWSSIEQDRKKVWRIFSRFGPCLMIRALTRTISLDAAVAKAGKRLGIRAGVVRMSQSEAVMDVDKLSDFEIAERIIGEREGLPDRRLSGASHDR